ncbi:MAG: 1-acyl-sn-glycerol-3-phosphate acyltransferase [Gemmatimonadetes bacterium]|nr:1-acyl-sn-glycerol-3-phosphate acyltransferase [Gemmatimonadota bacterium]
MQRLFSIWIWISTATVALLWLPWLFLVFLATAPFDPGRYVAGRWFRRAAVVAVALNPLWRFRTSGVRIDDPRRPYVAVSNHESIADIFLISHLPWEMKWLSKDSNFRIPVMGWMMRMAGDIRLVRSDRNSRKAALDECRDRLDKGVSVMIFPEGTRSPTGAMLPFKDGAFRLAIETGTPILPLVVAGTRDCIRKGSGIFNRAEAEVRALEPIPTSGLGPDDVTQLRDRVAALIARERDALFRELGLSSSAHGSHPA